MSNFDERFYFIFSYYLFKILIKRCKEMNNKETGKVKWFNAAKGFGFINRFNDETDIFVQYSQIKQKGYRTLNTGDEVEFTVFETKNGLQAKNVLKIPSR